MPTAPTPHVSAFSHAFIELSFSGGTGWETLEVWRDAGGGWVLYDVIYGGAEYWTDNSVSPKTFYSYKVRTYEGGEISDFSSTASETTLTAPPYNLASLGYDATTIRLNWENADAYSTIKVYRRTEFEQNFTCIEPSLSGTLTSYWDFTPSTGVKHYYYVISSSPQTVASNIVEACTKPSDPSALSITSRNGYTVNLGWTNGQTYTKIHVYRQTGGSGAFSEIATIDGSPSTYADDGTDPAQSYAYYIIAENNGQLSGPTNTASTGDPHPAAPSGLTITSRITTTINLGWTNGQTYGSVHVYRQTGGTGIFTEIEEVSGSPTTYADTDTDPLLVYAYYVVGESNGLLSSASNTAATDTPPPAIPTGLAAELQPDNHIVLTWENEGAYDAIRVARNGAEIARIGGNLTSFEDSGLVDGTGYAYKIRAERYGVNSDYTDEVYLLTALNPPTHLAGTCISNTEVRLTWRDTNQGEDGYIILRNGAYVDSVGANVESYNDVGLTPGEWYRYKVKAFNNEPLESAPSDEISIFTSDPPAAPSDLEAHAASTTRIDLRWSDNSDNETGFSIEESTDGGANYSEIATVGVGVAYYSRTGLTSNTPYYYRVHAYNDSGDSAYSNAANAQTFAAIAKPTGVVLSTAKVGGNYGVEITFDDNSELEDSHRIERKLVGGSYAEIAVLSPNQIYYFDSDVSAGESYLYQIRAKQGASSYSDYSDEATIAVPDVPAAPTNLAIGSKTDTTMRLTWTKTTGEVGYSIEKSSNGGSTYAEIARVREGVEYYLVTGLTAGATYYFKIRAYSAAGYSSYTSPVNGATDSIYQLSKFELLIRTPNVNPVILCEINPLMRITSFSLTAGKTYTYEAAIEERGIHPDAVYQNGAAYLVKASVNDVESTAGSFYFDYYGRKLYIHTTSGGVPGSFVITLSFKIYFTNFKDADFAADFNDNNYLPLLNTKNIPEFGSEVSPYYEGNIVISSGAFSIINARLGDGYYFDRRFALYEWRNRPVVWKMGAEDWDYEDYFTFYTALTEGVDVDDRKATFSMKDLRANIDMKIPVDKISDQEYPNVDSFAKNKVKAFYYGTVTNGPCWLVDTVNRRYLFQSDRVKSVQSVIQNETTLSASDYYIDYKRGTVTLSRSIAWNVKDIVLISFHGYANLADEEINTGGEIFLDIMLRFPKLRVGDLDLDSIYATKYGNTTEITVPLYRERSLTDVMKVMEKTLRAWTFQDAQGRIGLMLAATSPANPSVAVEDCQISDYHQEKTVDSLYDLIEMSYAENPQTQKYELLTRQLVLPQSASRSLPLETFHNSAANAAALIDQIIPDLNKGIIFFKTGLILFVCLPGHVIPFSRARYFSQEGAADHMNIRLLSVNKSASDLKVSVSAVKV